MVLKFSKLVQVSFFCSSASLFSSHLTLQGGRLYFTCLQLHFLNFFSLLSCASFSIDSPFLPPPSAFSLSLSTYAYSPLTPPPSDRFHYHVSHGSPALLLMDDLTRILIYCSINNITSYSTLTSPPPTPLPHLFYPLNTLQVLPFLFPHFAPSL